MPEYLAPGVYIEEIEIGARPIEGVSTSTTGFLGYAQRGPLNKPTLVTSFSDYQRIFGDFLPPKKDSTDLSKIRWLPYAVSAFFENGGKRAYITRVAFVDPDDPNNPDNAKPASGFLPKLAESGTPPVLDEPAFAGESGLKLTDTIDFTDKDVLLLKDGIQSEYLEFKGAAKKVSLKGTATLALAHAAGTKILKGEKSANVTTTVKETVAEGASEVTLEDVTNVEEKDYLLITGNTTGDEVVIVMKIEDTTITTKEPLRFGHAAGNEVFTLTTSNETSLICNVAAGESDFYADISTDFNPDDYIIIGSEYLQIEKSEDATDIIQIYQELKYMHEAGKPLVKLVPAVEVNASSEGTWGNSIKVAVKQSSLLNTKCTKELKDVTDYDRIDLETITGVEPGSLLKLPDTASPRYVIVKETHKTSTDETFVILEPPGFTGTIEKDDEILSEEFDLYVMEGKNDETFKHLSFNEKHSRYIEKIVTEKSSNLIRIVDITGPRPIILMPTPDDIPGWHLTDGTDGFPKNDNALNDIFEGRDPGEPDERTGLYTFKNIDAISIVAMPGINTKYLQQKLITHCEIDMKDRFAVLDPIQTADLSEIQSQRNLFDSSYAAIYYPWLYAYDLLEKKYTNIPPSGYICGIYARTDVDRGVHKAPANEKINGVVNLEKLNGKYRIVNKGTQEILNPLGINCIRIFPGRGIRVWGGRTISSNSLWKYVNVRRLFLYLEESIEEGTQWVVFEPNDEKLWARVKQTISQFLTRVWRDGALMGTTAEQAFFVKCDRTTMTQDDIDNGRLIVLIGVAPVKPAEFVIFRIAQWTGGSEVTE